MRFQAIALAPGGCHSIGHTDADHAVAVITCSRVLKHLRKNASEKCSAGPRERAAVARCDGL
jgi:hypothetical protein